MQEKSAAVMMPLIKADYKDGRRGTFQLSKT